MVLKLLAVRALLALAVTSDGGVLTTIDDALRLSPEEASTGQQVRLRGVVSYADPVTRDFFFQQSDGAGISLWYPDPKVPLTQGDLIEIEGRTERGKYAPKIAIPLQRLEVLAHGQPVPVTFPTQAKLAADGLDCRHIETDAVVRDVTMKGAQVELRLSSLLGPARLLFATGVPSEPLMSLAGAEIRVRATVGVDLNQAHQRVGLRLYAQTLDNLSVLHPSQPVSALIRKPLRELLRFAPTQQLDPRIVVEGSVIYAAGRQVFIAEEDAVVRLTLAESERAPLPPLGARVVGVGFVEPGDPLPRMVDVHLVSTGPGGDVAPVEVNGLSLLGPGLEDRLVRVQGRVSSVLLEPMQLLSLETSRGPALAMALQPGLLRPADLQQGATVEAVGIKSRTADRATPVVLLRRPEDLRLLHPPAFWTVRRVLALAGAALALALFMVLKWLWASTRARELQRLVDERTAALLTANRSLEERSTVLEAQQRELVELHHVRARFIATAAHDLRSPLMIVLSNATVAGREPDAARRRELLKEISESSEHINEELTRLVRSYCDERHLLRSERFDLHAAVSVAVQRARPLLARKGQVIEVVQPGETVWGQGDATIFGHVVLNLLSNASKFSPANTRITVSLSSAAPQVRVTDQGPGLDATNQARLFDLKQRPDVRPTDSEPSSGEGLLLCDRWMRSMGGTISCESAVGQGSTFKLSLPG